MQTKRLPFTGTYNTRPISMVLLGSSAIPGVAIPAQAIPGTVATTGGAKDTRFINCFQITQADQIGNSKRIEVVNRPGLAALNTPASGSIGNCIHVWTGSGDGTKVMSCFGSVNATLYDSTTSKGSITGMARGIAETSISATPTLLIAASDSTGWYYQSGTVTKITDVDFPGNASRTTVGNFAVLDGYAFIMDTAGRVYNSDLNSVTAWTADSYFTANSIPDVGIGVVRHRDTLIAFCKEHLEVIYNAGNPTNSPLARYDERTQKIGCISANAITELRDTIYFAGTTKGSNIAIYSYDGGQIGKVSTPEFESKLAFASPSGITLTTLGAHGRNLIMVCASSSTYVYCVEEKSWHEWTGTQLWHKADGVTTGELIVNYAISRTSTSGKVYVINPLSPTYQDDGSTFTSTIQTSRLDLGTDKTKFFNRIGIIGDSGSALALSWFDDDYITQSTPRAVTMTGKRPGVHNCGASPRRAFVITHSSNAAMRLEALELDFEVGSH